jgi:hypothetical protein
VALDWQVMPSTASWLRRCLALNMDQSLMTRPGIAAPR